MNINVVSITVPIKSNFRERGKLTIEQDKSALELMLKMQHKC